MLGLRWLLAGVGHSLELRKVISYACKNCPAIWHADQWQPVVHSDYGEAPGALPVTS